MMPKQPPPDGLSPAWLAATTLSPEELAAVTRKLGVGITPGDGKLPETSQRGRDRSQGRRAERRGGLERGQEGV
ncbi:hypothetical protein COCON_G00034930 [Conger conger]|uniref:Uncharacterized protein n=1 Tax=Conger conger TaxID=82655 RepID=A0A9Q1DZH7_CONCO|nr:hypothetical protein COCON_G00034930 [Conger conger]